MQQVAAGVHRWMTSHPAWEPDADPGSPDDWPREVGSVAVEAPDHLVLVDPLLADEQWAELDELVESHAKPVVVFTTVSPHERSRLEVCERYGARALSIRDKPPDGLDWIEIPGADEAMVWLPRAKVLIAGDRLLGDGHGGVRMCPASWLDSLPGMDTDQLRESLEVLQELPVEIVLVSHGDPVLHDGRAAIADALARSPHR